MSKAKKYDSRVTQNENDSTWTAEIIRRVTSKKTTVSKSQDGFSTQSEALTWAKEAIEPFVKNLLKQNTLRTEVQQEKAEKARIYERNKRQIAAKKSTLYK